MAKKKQSPITPDGLISGKVILPEVYQKLDEMGGPVKVICGVATQYSTADVLHFLSGMKIEFEPEENHTDYYVFATIANCKEAQRLEKSFADKKKSPCINHVWLIKQMRECVEESQKTINAPAARMLFDSEGEGVHWAVLDTGIDVAHAYFAANGNCSDDRRFDFTSEGLADVKEHGTHVAGIIAKIAPKVTLYDYKVLGAEMSDSSWTIRAMHDIRKKNFEAGETVIHGVNLSLGGSVEIGSYGCGWSPECQEANRLADSGVVVCVAAGNDGHKDLAAVSMGELEIYRTFMDVGILDPGNAEKVITIGSCHRTRPHSFGPSFFSSKGPTGDGRLKPDCLAPGEKIVSARAHHGEIPKSGTSMSCPHVSGSIAVFLSAKPEYKGRAAEVKRILLESCTDLERDKYFQGAGLVDLLRMIQKV